MRTTLKAFILFLILTLNNYANETPTNVYGSHTFVRINVFPSNAKIYINDEFKGTGTFVYKVAGTPTFVVRLERTGYKTRTIKYKFRSKNNPDYVAYSRSDFTVTIQLEKGESDLEYVKPNEGGDEGSELSKLETLKQDGLITATEATVLKDKLIDKEGSVKNTINELIELRKILNQSFITKEQFTAIKNKVINSQYDFTKPASKALQKLRLKSESGEYSKEDIAILKNNLLADYK